MVKGCSLTKRDMLIWGLEGHIRKRYGHSVLLGTECTNSTFVYSYYFFYHIPNFISNVLVHELPIIFVVEAYNILGGIRYLNIRPTAAPSPPPHQSTQLSQCAISSFSTRCTTCPPPLHFPYTQHQNPAQNCPYSRGHEANSYTSTL